MLAKHRRFAEEYVKDHSGARAAERAGYSPRRSKVTGSELLKRPDVAAHIAELEESFREEMGITVHGQLEKLRAVYEGALEDRSWVAAIRAVELESKVAGFLLERRAEVSIEHRVFTLDLGRDLSAAVD